MSDRTGDDKGFEARVAHLIHEAAKWQQGSGAHPPGLVKALAELREYFYARAAHELCTMHGVTPIPAKDCPACRNARGGDDDE